MKLFNNYIPSNFLKTAQSEPSWKGNPPPEWENDPHNDLETHATQQEEKAREIALSFRSQDTLTNLYLARELLAQEGGFEGIEDLLDQKIQELAYSDNAVEQLHQRRENEETERADAHMERMKDDWPETQDMGNPFFGPSGPDEDHPYSPY